MIENGFMYLASLVLFAGIVSTLEMKYKDVTFFKYVPTPVILYVGCMLFATFDLWASNDAIKDTYRTVRGHLIPAMIFVMLLRCDIRKILKLGPRMLLGFFCATFTIMTGFIVMFYFMKSGFPADGWKTWGALAGSWIGGTANMVAIQGALGIYGSVCACLQQMDGLRHDAHRSIGSAARFRSGKDAHKHRSAGYRPAIRSWFHGVHSVVHVRS